MDYLGKRPELAKLNAHCIQREMATELKAQIDRVYAENEKQIETIKRDIYSTV
jgi:hypothetical protein